MIRTTRKMMMIRMSMVRTRMNIIRIIRRMDVMMIMIMTRMVRTRMTRMRKRG